VYGIADTGSGATMTEWKPIFLLVKNSLIVLAMVVLVAVGLVWFAQQYVQQANSMLMQTQAELQGNQSQLDAQMDDLQNMENHIQRYEQLKAKGLVGDPQRTRWVEDFQASHVDVKLPNTLTVILQSSVPLAAYASEADPAGVQPYAHDMEFSLRDVHEQEVLDLIAHYKNRVPGRFRLQMCQLSGPKPNGLDARCVLRFVTVPAHRAVLTETVGGVPE
jgi:hypothetical protein